MEQIIKNRKITHHEIVLYLFIICAITFGFGNINGIIPFYFIDLTLMVSLLIIVIAKRKIFIIREYVVIILYIFFVTFLVNISKVDFTTIGTFGRFTLYSLVFVFLFKEYREDPDKIIKAYIIFCKIVLAIAIVQYIGLVLNIRILYDYSFLGIKPPESSFGGKRISSIATEPAWMIQYLVPLFYLSVGRLFFKDKFAKKFISVRLCILAFFVGLISLSSLFIITIPFVFGLYLIRLNFRKVIVFGSIISIVLGVSFVYVYNHSTDFKHRVDAVAKLSDDMSSSDNLSVFALLSNSYVTVYGIIDNPIFGVGMEHHRFNYRKYLYQIFPESVVIMELNVKDAGSFYLRIFSEFGFVGVIGLCYLIYSISSRAKNDYFSFYFSCLLLFGLRNGQYINPQFFLFFWGIVYSKYLKLK